MKGDGYVALHGPAPVLGHSRFIRPTSQVRRRLPISWKMTESWSHLGLTYGSLNLNAWNRVGIFGRFRGDGWGGQMNHEGI